MGRPALSVRRFAPEGTPEVEAVWLHGFQSDQGGEKAALLRDRMLAAGRAFTTYDSRGHGESEGALEDLTGTGLLEDCGRVVDGLPAGRRVVLVGSSMGAWTAAWWAARNPGRVHRLVLVAPAFRFPELIVEALGPDVAARWEREGRVTVDTGFGPVVLGWGLVRDGRRYRVEELAASLRTPALIVHGTADASCDWRESLAFAEACGGAPVDLLLLKGGDHRLSAHRDRLADAVLMYGA